MAVISIFLEKSKSVDLLSPDSRVQTTEREPICIYLMVEFRLHKEQEETTEKRLNFATTIEI